MCLQCGFILDYYPRDAEDAEATGPVGMFNKNLGWLINMMKEIDNVIIPSVTHEAAFADRIPLPRPKAPLEGLKMETTSVPAMRPSAVKGIITGPQKIEVSITSDADNTAAAQLAAAALKEKLASQNALPAWMTHSTVSNEMTNAGQREELARKEREAEVGLLTSDNAEEKKSTQDDSLDDVFAALEEDQRREQEARDREDDDEDEDEEDVFEDVAVGANGDVPEAKKIKLDAGAGTPIKLDVETPVTTVSGDAEESEEEFEDV